jgi:uncharacterized RDD family membrane protein YckC
MKNIEIITTQNVVLQYELATFRDRAMGYFIDLIFLVVTLSIVFAISAAVLASSETGLNVMLVLVTCAFIFYPLAFETLNKGQSIGKMAMRIQVITIAGGQATFSNYAARWAFRLVDIYFSLGGVASILVVSSTRAQRIGDVIANTAVVKVTPKVDMNLRDLLAIHQNNTYTPKYQQARKLHEKEALLIKSTLDRYRRFGNESHHEAIELLTRQVKQILDLDTIENDHVRFLQTVLQDYVILTR